MEWERGEVSGKYGGARAVWEVIGEARAGRATSTGRQRKHRPAEGSKGGEKNHRSNQQIIASRINMSGLASKAQGRENRCRSLKELWQLETLRGSSPASARLCLIALPQY